jgi:HAE1 family hydrophobic/amphiphilic exporter-1
MSDVKKPSLDWNSRLVEWFLQNAQLAIMLFAAVIIGGVWALLTLRTEGFPSADINIAVITDSYRGASPTEMEKQVVKPIEAAIQSVKGIKEIHSTARNSFASVVVSFEPGVDFKSSLSDLRGKVQNVALPKDADKSDINVPDVGGNASYYAVAKNSEGISDAEVTAAAALLQREIENISDVKAFKQQQEPKYSIGVKWRPADLAKNGITLPQLQQALIGNSITLPAGNVVLDGYSTSVVTSAPYTSISDIQAVVVGVNTKIAPPVPVKISDIADVYSFDATDRISTNVAYRNGSEITSHQALLYELTFKPTADLLKTDAKVQEAISKVKKDPELAYVTVLTAFNSANETARQSKEITEGAIGGRLGNGPLSGLGYLLGGVWLVILVMFIFVNWRAALISAAAIPLSLLFTLLALKLQGVTLNTLTLFSLILVLGLIVDPAIVVLEAIQHELDLGKRGREAVMAAVRTIGNGVFMAALTSMIVFVPFGVVSGVFGQIIRYIPITVIPALLASYFVPLLFLTYLAQRFLRPAKKAVPSDSDLSNIWKSSRWFVDANRAILKKKSRQIVIMITATILPLGITGAMFALHYITPVQFSAPKDSNRLMVSAEFPSNFEISKKQQVVTRLEPILQAEATIQSYSPISQNGQAVTFLVNLIPRSDRHEDSINIVTRLNVQLEALSDPTTKVYYSAKQDQVGPPSQDYPVAVNIYGDDLDSLRKAAIATGDLLRDSSKFPNVTRVEDGFTGSHATQIEVTLDRDKLQHNNLSSAQIAQGLAGLLGSLPVGKFDRTVDGTVQSSDLLLVGPVTPSSVVDIEKVIVSNTTNGPVYLKDVGQVREVEGFTGIQRLNGSRYVTIQAKVKDPLKDAALPQAEVKKFWTSDRLQQYGLRADALQDKGSGNEFVQSFKDLFLALAVAIVLTYMVLALFFRSFSQPFIILFAIPLSFIGVFPALYFAGGQFGFLEILGVITLVGIVENVGIFVIDLANRKRLEGVDYREAIAESTGIRFRPIFLTKVTALGGLLPLMIVSPFWRSLAVVVVAGILTSGVLSLFTTPILYSWFIELGGWFQRVGRSRARVK